jgi:hypothetical protein
LHRFPFLSLVSLACRKKRFTCPEKIVELTEISFRIRANCRRAGARLRASGIRRQDQEIKKRQGVEERRERDHKKGSVGNLADSH